MSLSQECTDLVGNRQFADGIRDVKNGKVNG